MRKQLVILSGEIRTPPFSREARLEAGYLLGCLQEGVTLSMPQAKPMPSIGPHCLELRIKDEQASWRILCRIDDDAILMMHVFSKKTQATPKSVLDLCRSRLRQYDAL